MKKSSGAAIVGASVSLFLAGCGSTPEPVSGPSLRTLNATEVRETLVDNSLYRRGREWLPAWEYVGHHRTDGNMTGRVWWSDGEEVVEGVWEVGADDLYCRTWSNHLGEGQRGCFRVSRDGDTLAFDQVSGARGDTDRYSYRILPGNAHGP